MAVKEALGSDAEARLASVCIPGIGPEVIAVFHAEKEVTPLGIAE